MQSYPLSQKKNRAGRIQLNRDGDQHKHGGKQDQSRQCNDKIKQSLRHVLFMVSLYYVCNGVNNIINILIAHP